MDRASLMMTLPEIVLSLGGIVLMMAAAFMGDKATRLIGWLAVALLAAAGLALTGPTGIAFDGLYSADAFSGFAKVLIYIAAAVCILIAPRFFESEDKLRAEYPVLILWSAAGMGMMVSAIDLLTLYVGLELQSLSAYVLASFMRKDQRSAEAGLKYFVLGALASGILLYGITLLYGFSGTTSFAGIGNALADGLGMGELFGVVFVLAGLAFKISAVPFHMWTPDVYEGAPTPVTAFFASAPKVAAMALIVRVAVGAMGPATGDWQQIVIFMALASIILGAAGAIGQANIKRLLAYSSINNVGFALVGLAAGTAEGVAATMSYMAIYVVMTLGSFLCVLQMRDADGNPVETIASLSGLSQTRKGLAAALAIFMFSLAGIPPLFGFWAKFLVFDAAVAANLLPLAAIGIAASVIGAFYYLKIIKTMYFDEPADVIAKSPSILESSLIAVSATVIVVGYGLIPGPGCRIGGGGGVALLIRTVAETASTNADLLALAAAGAPEGTWLRAETQTGGRGRMGREWHSPVGNLYASTIVRVWPSDPSPATLALVAAVALHEIVTAYAHTRPVSLKWPNDVMIDGAKLGGILLERSGDAIVIGFGVNLGFHPDGLDRAVTSLVAQGLEAPDPGYFCEDLARALAHWVNRWRGEGLGPIKQAWVAAAHPVGTPLSVRTGDDQTTEGLFDGLDSEGALRLRLADGSVRAIHAGDVFLV